METNNRKTTYLHTVISAVLLMLLFPAMAQKPQLKGFQRMADDINGTAFRLLYKLEGESYKLTYNQTGDFKLSLEPTELFNVKKTGDSTFIATIVNPKAMYEKYEEKPFKLQWFIIEL